MKLLQRVLTVGCGLALALMGLAPGAWGQVGGGAGGAGGLVGGELRGPTVIGGKVICARCTRNDVLASQPTLRNLYELHHPQEGTVVMQIAPSEEMLAYASWWQSDGAIWWQSIVGPGHEVAVRAPSALFRQLKAEENLLKQVQLTGLLRRTRTYDVDSIMYFESTPNPLAAVQQAHTAAERARVAAERAVAAADRAQGAAERAERAADRLMAMADTTEREFTANLQK